ncbi:MAG: O-antigen ligase family protein [Chloroflexota bacterium]
MALSTSSPLIAFSGDHPVLKRWIVALVLLFSLLIGLTGLGLPVLVLLFGAAGLFVLLRWPLIGLVLLIPVSLVIPFGIGTGTATSINATMLLLVALLGIWVLRMLGTRNLRLLRSPAIPPLLALVVIALVAFVVGLEPWIPFAKTAPLRAQIGGVVIFGLSAGAFLLVAHMVRDLRWLQWMVWAFLGLAALYIIARMTPGLGLVANRLAQRGAGDGSLFWTWLVALAFSQAAYNRQLAKPWRVALGLLVIGTLVVSILLGRDWTSGWLPSLVAILAVLLAASPRLAIAASFPAVVIAFLRSERFRTLLLGGDNDYSLSTRVEAAQILLNIIQQSNPILGLGPSNYYWYTPLFPIRGYAVQFNSHSQYIDLIAQTGIVGLLCFVWFAVALGWVGWRLRTQAPAGFAQAYVYGALGGLAGTVVAGGLGDWVLPFVYNIGFQGFRASVIGWLFMGGLVAVAEIVKRAPAPPGQAAGSANPAPAA